MIEELQRIEQELRKMFPHGHKDFIPLMLKDIELHSKKNFDYAAGGDPLGNFYRVANFLSNYPKLQLSEPAVVALVYALKQVDAVFWMLSNGHTAVVEGLTDKLRDISVYAKLALLILEEKPK